MCQKSLFAGRLALSHLAKTRSTGGAHHQAVDVALAVKRAARALRFPDHFAQGFHGDVVGFVQGVEPLRQALDGGFDAARLVDARLAITDGLPADVPVAVQVGAGFAPGRAARAVPTP